MLKMNDFEKLSTDSVDKDAIVSVTEVKTPDPEVSEKKPNILTIFFATIKQDKAYFESDGTRRLPNLKYTILCILSAILITVFVLVMNFVIGYGMLIPIVSCLFTLVPPIIIIIFFFELDPERTINLFTLSIAFLLGFVSYVILNFVASFLYQLIPKERIEQIGFPAVLAVICFLDTLLLANSFKTNKTGDCFLIAVTIMLGFCVTNNIVQSFDKLFVIDGMVSTGTYNAPPGAGAIINTGEFLKGNYTNLFENWLFDYFVLPHLYACWAVVTGFLVSVTGESRLKKRETPKSIYLLLMLCILINVIAVIDTAIEYLEIILKIIAFIGSTALEITFINMYLKESF